MRRSKPQSAHSNRLIGHDFCERQTHPAPPPGNDIGSPRVPTIAHTVSSRVLSNVRLKHDWEFPGGRSRVFFAGWNRAFEIDRTIHSCLQLQQPGLSKRFPRTSMGGTDPEVSASLPTVPAARHSRAHLNNAPVNTPPGTMTPPVGGREPRASRSERTESNLRHQRSRTLDSAVDAGDLGKALMRELQEPVRSRDVTPGGSPSRKRQRVYGDR